MEGLDQRKEKWRTLREINIAINAEQERSAKYQKMVLLSRVLSAELDKGRVLDEMGRELDGFLKKPVGEKLREQLSSQRQKFDEVRAKIRSVREKIKEDLQKADTSKILDLIKARIVTFEQTDVRKWELRDES